MADPTPYESLIERLRSAAKRYPRSYVVIDGNTQEILGRGTNAGKVLARVKAKLKEGQIPVMYKMPKKGEILILPFS